MSSSRPQLVIRFSVPDRDAFDRVAGQALPDGFEEMGVDLHFYREVHYDTPAADLEEKHASVRLQLRNDGPPLLRIEILERLPGERGIRRHTQETELPDAEPASLFRDGGDATRLIQGLIDPARLAPVFEVEVLRRVRTLRHRAASDDADILMAVDTVTARSGDLAGELLEVELAVDETGAASAQALAGELQRRHQLLPVFVESASRARELFQQLELRTLQAQIRGAREVVLVVHDRGEIALFPRHGRLQLPWAPGAGAKAARRALRRAFGHGRARIRLLGVRGDLPGRPALEVWLAEDVEPAVKERRSVWLPVERALRRAGSPRMRDARTLAALQVVARSSFVTWAPPALGPGMLPRPTQATEPFEVVLQRLEAADTAWEPPASDVPPEQLLNMDLSRLAFDDRVLSIAEDPSVPLLERLRFLSMFGARRDDFFMSRVAHFKRAVARGDSKRSIDGLTPAETLDAIGARARTMMHRAYEVLNEQLLPALQEHGIRVERWDSLADEDRQFVRDNFAAQIDALVMPIAADPSHPFPHVRNLRPALAAIVRTTEGAEQFVAIETPGELPRFIPLRDGRRFVLVEDVIEDALPRLYPGLEVLTAHTFRVTRSAHIDLGGEPLDMLQAVEEEVSRRPFQEVIRLEVEHAMPPAVRHRLLREFQYEMEDQLSTPGEQDVYTAGRLVDLAALAELADLDMEGLRFEPMQFRSPLSNASIFDQLDEGDRLFHFPHDDFPNTVERFLMEAAEDDDVISVRTTLYRTSPDSGIVAALRRARERGKEVAVLVELKASFDERRNIEWARGLEKDGIRVVFSPVRLKVHAKLALVVRRSGTSPRRYAYIGTGNLNASTARSYVDVGLLTADQDLAREVGSVFNLLTGYSGGGAIDRLLVAPFDMRRRLLRLIDREAEHARAGRQARIRVQLNGLADRRIIGALYRASAAGVRIEMMVREICSLRPGVPGLSENITVVSVVGRLLQHARIMHFHNNGSDEYYIGSADWRPRNLAERIEVATPVSNPEHHARLDGILDATLNASGAWVLQSDGEWVKRTAGVPAL
jgi:polyphosphate kinase